ncbi:hypothetical protein DOTSEDRAFT_72716 [Dothistroma septosporum NZE10]|uniref:Histidine kinase n=1 Tax=Dothistroma septosporum (strain NZE10 / CBS 128990) TaxID=675120 RepID=M2Y599_DOTSN|nr:hypothetical protein DOTSEDRAFT_72716 [Dothistroma septosporum NZE10]
MASLAAEALKSERRKLLFESKREREFYRYYQPIRELTKAGPPLCDVGNADALGAHRPFSSPDRALTAFCQLGALRLGTKRAMLLFFDSQYAYVLAESTKTLSLQNDSVHDGEDDLWLGHTRIPRGYSVCEHTVNLPANQGSNKDNSHAGLVHIVNDLSDDTRFCNRPYVTGGPMARFYAGVPITTPRGITIGAYCVLDDKKRDGLEFDAVHFMRDMAATVMTHLEMVRATGEHKIGTQMIAGLGAFIDGASGFRDWTAQKGDWGVDEDPHLYHPLGVQPMTANVSAVAQAAVQVSEHLEEERRTNINPAVTSSSPKRNRSRTANVASSGSSSPLNPRPATSGTQQGRTSAENVAEDGHPTVQRTFERASNLVREAMCIDGVMFLDAAIGTFGGLVETSPPAESSHTEHSSDNHGSTADGATTGTSADERMTRKSDANDQSAKHCHVLASSSVAQPLDEFLLEKRTEPLEEPQDMTEKFLRSLLRRYPRGKVWSFNEYGDASSDDDSSEGNTDGSSCRCSAGSMSQEVKTHSANCSKRRKKGRRDDGAEIVRLFPGVRSVGLVGMWDHTRQRWYAACVFWSYSPLRLFSEESEVKYMTAFCDVILAELHRLEAQDGDKAKSDFISTISHELRSPLHGILGSVECLQEQPTDSFSTDLISQVEICGRTLLDIIDHLLDFSKINHQARSRNKDAQAGRLTSGPTKRTRMGGVMALDANVALDQVTEEIVETAVYSFCCSRNPDTVLNRKVAVILDIDRTADLNWHVSVGLGAWKRICINLVSNALKYTSNGHIRVSLMASPIPDKRKRFNVIFTVSDTGRGMSRDFLENYLFRAFAQEDSLVEGTGLGMNLVAKIVKSLEGKIEVQSERGHGTTFSITLPLEQSRASKGTGSKNSLKSLERIISGISIGVVDSSSTPLATSTGQVPDETARSLLLSSVHKTLNQIGVNAFPCTWAGDDGADMYFVTECELGEELKRRRDMGCADTLMSPSALSSKPFIVLCESTLSARKIRAPGFGNIATGYVELIAQPAGPDRLAKAIVQCVRNRSMLNEMSSLAGAIIPGISEHPHRSTNAQDLPDRTKVDAGNEETEQLRVAKLERGLASDYKFPRVPTPSLNGSRPERKTSTHRATQTSGISPERKGSGGGSAGVSLLLVDDNSINLQLLVTYADKFGHRKQVATDGLQAVEAYKNACAGIVTSTGEELELARKPSDEPPMKPQVVLMDINMPILNGFEATRQIRGFEKQKGLEPATIVALTGLGSASAQQEAFSSGVDLFLTKPVRLKELTKILDGIQNPKK